MAETFLSAWEKSPTQDWLRNNPDRGAQYIPLPRPEAKDKTLVAQALRKPAFKEAGPVMEAFTRDFLAELGKKKSNTVGDLLTNMQEAFQEVHKKHKADLKKANVEPLPFLNAKSRDTESLTPFAHMSWPINEYKRVTHVPGLNGRSIDTIMLDGLSGKENRQGALSIDMSFAKLKTEYSNKNPLQIPLPVTKATDEHTVLNLATFGKGVRMNLDTPLENANGSGPIFEKKFSQTASVSSPTLPQEIERNGPDVEEPKPEKKPLRERIKQYDFKEKWKNRPSLKEFGRMLKPPPH